MTRTLLETARAATRGEATATEVFEAFISATVFSPAPPQPGVHVVELGGQRVVPVFTSEAELARFMGVTNWFSTTGADLLHLLPPGVTASPAHWWGRRGRPRSPRRIPSRHLGQS